MTTDSPSFFDQHPRLKDMLNFLLFIALVSMGTLLINTYVFRSFSVLGPSMETTFFTGDRLIVNRIPISFANFQNKQYLPARGDIIVFKNPHFVSGEPDEYIVKRVIAFPGERVVVANGKMTVYNSEHPEGFDPDALSEPIGHPGSFTSGSVDMTVSDGTVFVSGDHRKGNCSYDSRSGLGTIPSFDIIGPVAFRIWPFPGMGPSRVADSPNRTTTCES